MWFFSLRLVLLEISKLPGLPVDISELIRWEKIFKMFKGLKYILVKTVD